MPFKPFIRMKKKSILIAVNEKLLRETWSAIFNADNRFKVVAATGKTQECLTLLKKHHPAIVITDIHETQLKLLPVLTSGKKPVAMSVIFILTTVIPSFVREVIKTGVSGLITKNSSLEEMIHAITEVSEKRKYICTEFHELWEHTPDSQKQASSAYC